MIFNPAIMILYDRLISDYSGRLHIVVGTIARGFYRGSNSRTRGVSFAISRGSYVFLTKNNSSLEGGP